MTLAAGTLNRRILIERKQVTEDPLGGEIVQWVPLAGDGMLWANIRFLNGTETVKSDTRTATAKASIRIRYREDIEPTCRVKHRGVIFEILAVLPDLQGREFVDLAVETGATNG